MAGGVGSVQSGSVPLTTGPNIQDPAAFSEAIGQGITPNEQIELQQVAIPVSTQPEVLSSGSSSSGSSSGGPSSAPLASSISAAQNLAANSKVFAYTLLVPWLAAAQLVAKQGPDTLLGKVAKFDPQSAFGTGLAGASIAATLGGGVLPAVIQGKLDWTPAQTGTTVAGFTTAFLNFGFPRDGNFNNLAAASGTLGPTRANYIRFLANGAYAIAFGSAAASVHQAAVGGTTGSGATGAGTAASTGNGRNLQETSDEAQADADAITQRVNNLIAQIEADPSQYAAFKNALAAPNGEQVVANALTGEAAMEYARDEAGVQLSKLQQLNPDGYATYMSRVSTPEQVYAKAESDTIKDSNGIDKLLSDDYAAFETAHPNGTALEFYNSLPQSHQAQWQHYLSDFNAAEQSASTMSSDALINWLSISGAPPLNSLGWNLQAGVNYMGQLDYKPTGVHGDEL